MAKKDKDKKKKGEKKLRKADQALAAASVPPPLTEAPPAPPRPKMNVIMPSDSVAAEDRPPYDLAAELADCADTIGRALNMVIGGEPNVPARLADAMRHAVLGGGKRIRPLLARQAASVFNESPMRSRGVQVAIELVHCYSLVHDDLPAMDNDDLRRGRPTVHKAFDEATAILAGDALLTMAFGWLASSASGKADVAQKLVAELADAAGAGGMVGGQMLDMAAETGSASIEHISTISQMKTGRLIRAAVRLGAILGEASEDGLEAITRYGEYAGEAFQLSDDLLDATSTTEKLGKKAGKDAAAGKQTLVGHIGVEAAQRRLGDLVHHAIDALAQFGPEADGLRATAQYIAARQR